MRQSNTTFVNLRAALDDVEPLINTAKPATKNLAPFLAELRPVLDKFIPFTRNLALALEPARPAQRHHRTAGDDPGRPAARLERVPARRSGDRRLPAAAQLRPLLHAGPVQRARPSSAAAAGAYDGNGNYVRASISRRRTSSSTKAASSTPITRRRTVQRLHLDLDPASLPGRRHAAAAGQLQPLRRTRRTAAAPSTRPNATRTGGRADEKDDRRGRGGGGRRRRDRADLAAAGRATATSCGRSSTTARSWSAASRCASRAPTSARSSRSASRCRANRPPRKTASSVDVPGKAIIELEIADPSFQDFRQDASCQIRPQSLIGEKYVDCRPTLPRAPGQKPAPPLKQIPEGEPGEGQYLLPLGRNQTSVDPDLINDINSLPYAQRFRLIFNELGAGLAGRGEDLEAAIKKANPTLRDVDKLFGELTEQKDQLAQLAAESQEILEPLTREKEHVVGFLAHSGEAAEASSEHGAELEAALQKFPRFLVEFRQTMGNLKEFSDAGTPLLEEPRRRRPLADRRDPRR